MRGIVFLLIICSVQSFSKSANHYDSLNEHYTNKIRKFIGMSNDSLKYYVELQLSLAKELNDVTIEALAYRNFGTYYWQTANYEEALNYYNKALAYFQQIQDDSQYGSTLMNIGLVYATIGYKEKALANFYEALRFLNHGNDKRPKALTLNSIGVLFKESNLLDSAELMHIKAGKLFKDLGDVAGVAGTYMNIGSIYRLRSDSKSAIQYQLKALHLFDSIGNVNGVTSTLNSIAETHFLLKEYGVAKAYRLEALAKSKESNNMRGLISALTGLGKIELTMQNPKKAEEYLVEARNKASQFKLLGALKEILELLGNCHEQQGKHDQASLTWKSLLHINDSLYQLDRNKQLENIKFEYSLKSKEDQINLLKKDNEIVTLYRNLAILLAGTLLLFGIGVFLRIKLKEQKRIKEMLEKEVTLRTYDLAISNKQKDLLFSVISHDLRSPINSLRSLLDLLSKQMISNAEFISLSGKVHYQVRETSFLLENLLAWSKGNLNKANPIPKQIAVRKLVDMNIELFKIEMERKNISTKKELQPDNLTLFADVNELDIVVRNLLNNAIKYSNVNSTIELTAWCENTLTFIQIKDFGIGMNQEQLNKLFALEKKSTRGTQNELGSGLGLLLVKELVERNNGIIYVISESGKGTTVTLEFKNDHHVETDLVTSNHLAEAIS